MDAETLQTFLEEAESYLPAMREGIMAYERDAAGRLAELQTTRRLAHTVKGAALMVGLSEVGKIAGEIEDGLKTVVQSKAILTEEAAAEFLSQILVLEAYLNRLRVELNAGAGNPPNATGESLEIPQNTNLRRESDSANRAEDFEIDAEMLEVFAEEAEDLLRNIGTNLGVLERTPNDCEALLEIRRSSHTLKGSAGIIGLKKLSALAHRVEDLLDYLAENKIDGNAQILELLLASTDCFSALAGGENSAELDRKIERLYQNFDEVLALLKAEESSPVADSRIAQPEEIQPEFEQTAADIACTERQQQQQQQQPSPPEHQSAELPNQNRAVIRVSVERLNGLFDLVSEMVLSRSVFEQRLTELERQTEELHRTTQRLRVSTGKLETDYEFGAPENSRNFNFPSYHFAGGGGGGEKLTNPLANLEVHEFDTLEFDRYTEFHQNTRELVETASDTSAINVHLDNVLDNLKLLFDNQRRLIEGMQDHLLRLRMVSLSSLTQRLHRTVRVTAQEEGKLVDLIVENDQVAIETEILDSFVEPLVHLLRNAVAHGIEPAETRRILGKPERGKITLRCYSEGTHVVFVVSDDGRGISVSDLKEKAVRTGLVSEKEVLAMSDEEAYSLVFLPGLSTAAQINQVSGRGVGMNVVSSIISRRHGTISIKSEPQKGTGFTVRLPTSMAVTRALLVKTGAQTFAFPLKLVKQVTELSQEAFEKTRGGKVLTLGGVSYSFFRFHELLDQPPTIAPQKARIPLILLEAFGIPCALAVDQILKTEEIVIKPLGAALQNVPEIIGATILGDGVVVPVLDLVYLLKGDEEKGKKEIRNFPSNEFSDYYYDDRQTAESNFPRLLNVLVVDDSPSVRQINSNLIKNAGWSATIAKDGLEALELLQSMGEMPDVILTDVEMPRMDGYELLAWLKRQPALRNIPVIMITSRAGDKHRRKAFDLGVEDYLTKPYEDAALLDKIKKLAKAD